MKLTHLRHSVILTIPLISLVTLMQFAVYGQKDSYTSAQSISSKEKTVNVEVINPADSPVLITFNGINDNPNFENIQMVSFSIQNLSQKRIIAFVPLLSSASFVNGSTTDNRYDFDSGKMIQTAFQEKRNRLKSDEKLSLSIDFVLFADLTWWGADTQKQSEFMAGYYEGEKFAIDKVKELIKEKNKEELFELLRLEEMGKVDEKVYQADKEKTDKWRQGFLNAFQIVLVRLLPFDQKQGKYLPISDNMKLDGFLLRLKNIEITRAKYLDNPK